MLIATITAPAIPNTAEMLAALFRLDFDLCANDAILCPPEHTHIYLRLRKKVDREACQEGTQRGQADPNGLAIIISIRAQVATGLTAMIYASKFEPRADSSSLY